MWGIVHDDTIESRKEFPVPTGFAVQWGDVKDDGPKNVHIDRAACERELRRTVREVFGGHRFTPEDAVEAAQRLPSTSSNYNMSRNEGGGLGDLIEDPWFQQFRGPGGFVETEGVEVEHVRLSVDVAEDGSVQANIDVDPEGAVAVEGKALKDKFIDFWPELLIEAVKEQPIVKPVGLAEPLKIRVITKGPPKTYYVLKCIQQWMFKIMKEHKVFKLIGTPNTWEEMQEMLGTKPLSDLEEFLSGDYKGATDNLDGWVSETLVDELFETSFRDLDEQMDAYIKRHVGLDPNEVDNLYQRSTHRKACRAILQRLIVRALTGHIFIIDGKLVMQREGQLMGSVVSFGFLCLGNAGMSRWSMELGENRVIPLKNARMAVNGDDVVLKTAKATYKFWSWITQFVGLEESIGKTFRSSLFFTINSQVYYVLVKRIPYLTERINKDGSKSTVMRYRILGEPGYVNYGIVNRLGTLQDKRGRAQAYGKAHALDQISKNAIEIKEKTPESMFPFIYKRFLAVHWDTLKSAGGVAWAMPTWLGGLGLPEQLEGPHKVRNSELDYRVASYRLLNWSAPGALHPASLGETQDEWLIRQAALKRIGKLGVKPHLVTDKDSAQVKAYQRLTGTLTLSLLFDSSISLGDLLQPDDPKGVEGKKKKSRPGWRAGAKLRANQKFWTCPKGKLPRLPDEVFTYEKRYEAMNVRFSEDDPWPEASEPLISIKERVSAMAMGESQRTLATI